MSDTYKTARSVFENAYNATIQEHANADRATLERLQAECLTQAQVRGVARRLTGLSVPVNNARYHAFTELLNNGEMS